MSKILAATQPKGKVFELLQWPAGTFFRIRYYYMYCFCYRCRHLQFLTLLFSTYYFWQCLSCKNGSASSSRIRSSNNSCRSHRRNLVYNRHQQSLRAVSVGVGAQVGGVRSRNRSRSRSSTRNRSRSGIGVAAGQEKEEQRRSRRSSRGRIRRSSCRRKSKVTTRARRGSRAITSN